MTSGGVGDLMEALAALHDRFGCEATTAAFRLQDGALMTVSLDAVGNLQITRDVDGALVLFSTAHQRRRA